MRTLSNNIVLVFILIFCFAVNNAEGQKTTKVGCNYLKGEQLFPRSSLTELCKDVPLALTYAKKGRRFRITGHIVSGVGMVPLGMGIALLAKGSSSSGLESSINKEAGTIFMILGSALQVSSYYIYRKSNRYNIKAIDIYSNDPIELIRSANYSSKVIIGPTNNGMGLTVTF